MVCSFQEDGAKVISPAYLDVKEKKEACMIPEWFFIGVLCGMILGAISAWTGSYFLREYQRKHNIFNYDEICQIIKRNPALFDIKEWK